MDIQVLDIRLLAGDRPLKAFCDMRLGDIMIRDFRVYQANGKPSVRNPHSTYKDHEGNLTFREIISLPSMVQSETHALILSEYFRRLEEKKNGKPDR